MSSEDQKNLPKEECSVSSGCPCCGSPFRMLAILAVLIAGSALMLRTRSPQTIVSPAVSPPPVVDASPMPSVKPAESPAPAPAIVSASSGDFHKLKGRWQRSGENYILEVRDIDSKGVAEATYFNPNPIHVAQAKAAVQDGHLLLFVELRDTNYPGCTYRLLYDPERDALMGTYYQAAIQENYDVGFERVK